MPLQHGMYEFRSAVDKLREIVTPAVLAEFGEELTADNLRDIMSGGTAIRARMTEKFNAALAPIVFPAERSQKEELYTSLLEQFNEICRKVQKRFESFGTVPADCYTVDSNGQVTFDSEVAEAVFSEAANLYIDDPQQIELYNAALKALSALQELDTLARKYGMYAINRTNYRAIIDMDIEMSPTMGVLSATQVLRINYRDLQSGHSSTGGSGPRSDISRFSGYVSRYRRRVKRPIHGHSRQSHRHSRVCNGNGANWRNYNRHKQHRHFR